MTTTTIRQLNQLNQQFYSQIAVEFSQTRQQFWEGWHQLLPILHTQQPLSVLDIGCGNGRFAHFLVSEGLNIQSYHGIDSNSHLLALAEQKLAPYNFARQFTQLDIVESLLREQPIITAAYNTIVLFGVAHHLPGERIRQSLFQTVAQHLTKNGVFIFTTWQFHNDTNLLQRRHNPQEVHVDVNELEPGDYFLDWQKGEMAIRFCHWYDETEARQLTDHAQLSIQAEFDTDTANRYYICKKVTAS